MASRDRMPSADSQRLAEEALEHITEATVLLERLRDDEDWNGWLRHLSQHAGIAHTANRLAAQTEYSRRSLVTILGSFAYRTVREDGGTIEDADDAMLDVFEKYNTVPPRSRGFRERYLTTYEV